LESFETKVRRLILQGAVRISDHGYEELAEDHLSVREIVESAGVATLLEEYASFAKGPCALFLQQDANASPIHVVWGIPKGYDGPAVLVTAYRPDPKRWDQTFRRRLK
jgi:hypothetical protein